MTNTITSIVNTCNIQSLIRLQETNKTDERFSDTLAYQIQGVKPVGVITPAKREDKKKEAEASEAKNEKEAKDQKQMASMRINTRIAAELILTGKVDNDSELINPVSYRRAYYMD